MTGGRPDPADRRPGTGDFDARLKAAIARDAGKGAGRDEETRSGVNLAFRIGIELVAGVVVGVLIGWALDRWLDTAPWLMVLFFFLGSAAGMINVYRTMSGIGHGVGYRPEEDKPKTPDGPEGKDPRNT